MTTVEQLASSQEVSVEIGGMPIVLRTPDPGFLAMVEQRYHGYLGRPGASAFSFDVEVRPDYLFPPDDGENELRVWKELGRWRLERGDFLAESKLTALEHAADGRIDLAFQFPVFRAQIEKRDGIRHSL